MEILQIIKKKMSPLFKYPFLSSLAVFILCVGTSVLFFDKRNVGWSFFIAAIFWLVLLLMKREGKKDALLVDMGLQEIDLGLILWDNYDINDILQSIFKWNNDTIPKEIKNVFLNFTQNIESELTIHILSFAFPAGIPNKNIFKLRLLDGLKEKAAQYISSALNIKVDDTLKFQVNDAFCFEVWFTDISGGKCYWMIKPFVGGDRVRATHGIALTGEARERGVALVSQNYQAADCMFEIDDKKNKLAFNRYIPVIVGPNNLNTGVIDIYANKVVGNFPIGELERISEKTLGLHILEYGSPFPMKDRWIVDRGGYIKVEGHYNAGQFHEIEDPEQKYQTPLSKSLKNIFQNAEVPMVPEVKKVANLLQEFVSDNPAVLKGTVAGEGNFEIIYRETDDGNRRKYHIKEMNWVTRYFPKDDYDTDNFKKAANYHDFAYSTEGFAPIPFTEGYLMTGPDDRTWLCLYVSAGSPAASSSDRYSQSANDQLTSYLEAYARINRITDLYYMPEATQGWVARGTQGNKKLYLKLLNPEESNFYSTEEIVRKLKSNDVLPDIVQMKRINRNGMEEPGGICIFETDELKSLAQLLDGGRMQSQEKLMYCIKLANFSQQLIRANIVCTDFTLKDTVEFDSEEKKYIFVCDYGSYIKSEYFMLKNLICKSEYESPEDKYEEIDLLPEPYQVFKLGILFYQFIVNSSYKFPKLTYEGDKGAYKDALDEDITARADRLPQEQKKFADLIREMLNWYPIDRPRLSEVVEKLQGLQV